MQQAAYALARPSRSRGTRTGCTRSSERHWRLFAEILFIVPAYVAYQFVRSAVGGQAGTAFDNATRAHPHRAAARHLPRGVPAAAVLPREWMVDCRQLHLHLGPPAGHHRRRVLAVHAPPRQLRAVPQRLPDLRPDRADRLHDGAAGAAALHAGVRLHGHDHPRAVVLRLPEPEDREPVRGDAEPALRLGPARRRSPSAPARRKRWVRYVALFMPLFTLSGIVLTANHYFLDAAAGALVA